jgi:hypothetical protein
MNRRLIISSRSPVHGFVASSAAMLSRSRFGVWGDGFTSAARQTMLVSKVQARVAPAKKANRERVGK